MTNTNTYHLGKTKHKAWCGVWHGQMSYSEFFTGKKEKVNCYSCIRASDKKK